MSRLESIFAKHEINEWETAREFQGLRCKFIVYMPGKPNPQLELDLLAILREVDELVFKPYTAYDSKRVY